MASTIQLDVKLNQDQALAGLKAIADAVKPLTTPVKLNVDTKGALSSLRDLNAIASNLEKQLNKPFSGLASGLNDYDRAINTAEAESKKFSNALRQQMESAQAAESAHKGLASSMNVIDQAIQAAESAGKSFSAQLRMQMQAAQDDAKAQKALEAEQRKAEKAARDQAQAQKESTTATQESATAATSASGAFNALSVALGSIAARAFHMVVSKITQGIREALTEMKDVDTELTNISKVSGITGQALADMGERAYETASRYGVAADEYLSAVYTFQKAGLGPSAEAMGELAVKTMLVGDTTADVASQFLISANAAWKFGGDIERLNQIVDEADYINNNYATDLEKLSSGLPRVASVAAQAGMSAEETLAAIGTITAVTQESGTKAATALRALILNIEGQVGEFVDDTGETFKVTEESVKSMEGLMNKYAKAELEAAKASGELINPMTAIKAIFEGMANSDLNDQELFTLLSGMGGKLRTNQLTALVQNYQLFDDMLGKIANSAGTADSEISLMMESWERKTQVLKNTWTEFIADIVSTDFAKDFIDSITAIVAGLDTLVSRGTEPWYDSGETNKEIESTEGKIKDLLIAISDLYLKDDADSKLKLQDLQAELQIQQEILETKKAQYALEHAEEAKKLQKQLTRDYLDSTGTWTRVDIEELNSLGNRLGNVDFLGNISEYQASLKAIISDFSDYYDKVQQVKEAGGELTAEQEQFVKNYELANNLAEQQGLHIGKQVDGYWELIDSTGNVVAAVKDITQEQQKQTENYKKQLDSLDDVEEYTQSLRDSAEEIPDSTSAYEESIARARGEAEGLSDETSNDVDVTNALVSAVDSINFTDAIGGAEALARAMEAAANAAAGISPGVGFASGTPSAPGGKALVNELGPELISSNGKAYIANGGRPGIVNLRKGDIVLPAGVTRQALKGSGFGGSVNAFAGGTSYGTGLTIFGGSGGSGGSSAATEAQRARQEAIDRSRQYDQTHPQETWVCNKCGTVNPKSATKCSKCGAKKPGTTSRSGGGKGGGGGKSKKERAADKAKELSEKLSNIDKRATLAHTEKRYGDEANLYKKAIKLIKQQVSRYRKAGYKDTSNEIVDLLNKIHDYEAKIESLNKTQWDDEIDARKAEIEARRKQQEQQSKEDAAEKARIALENAKNQRNVRMFNAATGQWEWIADQGAIDKAQQQYDSAQEALLRAQEDAELEALRERRDSGEAYKTPSLVGDPLLGTGVSEEVISRYLDQIHGVSGRGIVTNSAAVTALGGGGNDSHDTVYNFGNITMSESEAESTSVADLARKLSVLKIS